MKSKKKIFLGGNVFFDVPAFFIKNVLKCGGKGMKEHIKHWYPKDETFFKVLSIAGNIRQEDAVKIDISASRLKNMEKDKLIEKVTYPSRYNSNPKSSVSYGLTKKGRNFIEQKYGISRGQSSHAAEHNCKVAEIICNLDKREIGTVQAEWQTRDQMAEALEQMKNEGDYDQYDYYMDLWKTGLISAVDVVYTSVKTGELVCCEVVTNSYKDSDIAAKEVCGEILHTEVEYVRV